MGQTFSVGPHCLCEKHLITSLFVTFQGTVVHSFVPHRFSPYLAGWNCAKTFNLRFFMSLHYFCGELHLICPNLFPLGAWSIHIYLSGTIVFLQSADWFSLTFSFPFPYKCGYQGKKKKEPSLQPKELIFLTSDLTGSIQTPSLITCHPRVHILWLCEFCSSF